MDENVRFEREIEQLKRERDEARSWTHRTTLLEQRINAVITRVAVAHLQLQEQVDTLTNLTAQLKSQREGTNNDCPYGNTDCPSPGKPIADGYHGVCAPSQSAHIAWSTAPMTVRDDRADAPLG
jgi:hypothetical protein